MVTLDLDRSLILLTREGIELEGVGVGRGDGEGEGRRRGC